MNPRLIFQLKNFSRERTIEFAKKIYEVAKTEKFLTKLGKIKIKKTKVGYSLFAEVTDDDKRTLAGITKFNDKEMLLEVLNTLDWVNGKDMCLLLGLYVLNKTDFKLLDNEDVYYLDFYNKINNYKDLYSYKNKVELLDIMAPIRLEIGDYHYDNDLLNLMSNSYIYNGTYKSLLENYYASDEIEIEDVFEGQGLKF